MQLPVLAITLVAFACGAGVAEAQTARTVYAPMTFNTESRTLRTSACLQLTERTYPATPWWESAGESANPADRAFKGVIAAIKQKDRAALLKLTDAAQGRDTVKFNRQADAFFQQFDVIRLVQVTHAYEFDGLVAFFGKFQAPNETAYVPMVFQRQADASFGFLPMRSDRVTFKVVADWFAPSNVPLSDTPAYCTDADVKRVTHKVALVPGSWQPSALLLTGAPIEASGRGGSPTAGRMKATIDEMKASLRNLEGANIEPFLKYVTVEGAVRLRQWFADAQPKERDDYKAAFIEQTPFFVFDEFSLMVAYTKTRQGDVQVLYFTYSPDKRLVWTNSAYITVSDEVFKHGPLFGAASAPQPPFSGVVIK